jgi:PhoPQ-activated pathogenicity-related protein
MVRLEKPDWEITATTVYCDDVNDEVTLMVYADGTSRCTGRQKYLDSDKETSRAMKKKARRPRKLSVCLGDDCPRLKQYRDSILSR